ncbi:hypothetical protein ASF25_04060 [Methylobacterium sp. Leaf100]|nr:hypothetical protein ASF25_04060 [Methylobacterium sp. Leaf100]
MTMIADRISAQPAQKTHLDIYDTQARSIMATRLGVSEDRLRKAVHIVGSRISTLTSYFHK